MTALTLIPGVLVGLGALFFLAGTVGLLRFPDAHSRLHALTKADNLALGLVCAGIAVHAASLAVAAKLLLIWLLTMLASSISSFLIAGWAEREGSADHGSEPPT